jgi:hypothetical protein
MRCPTCNAAAKDSLCSRCGTNLSPLQTLQEQAQWHGHQCIGALKKSQFADALSHAEVAVAYHRTPETEHVWMLALLCAGRYEPTLGAWVKKTIFAADKLPL